MSSLARPEGDIRYQHYKSEPKHSNNFRTELTGIYLCGRELTVTEWKEYIWSEISRQVTELSHEEIIDLLAIYHPSKVEKGLGHTRKELLNNPAISNSARERLKQIRESGDNTNSVYSKTGENLDKKNRPKFNCSSSSKSELANRIGMRIPEYAKIMIVMLPVIGLIGLALALRGGSI